MGGRLLAYSDYSDSGVDWIGVVPSHWNVLATSRISDLTTGGRDTQDANEDGRYPFFVRSQTVEHIDTFSFEGESVLTSGDGAGVGKIFHHHVGKLEFHQRVYLFHNFRRVSGRFFFYFFREHLHYVALAGNAKSTVDSLRRPMLRMFPIALPSLDEQEHIVAFLDYETARIDALIEKQEQLIGLLKEKRQAVISHAVTKGLNPDAPMRDSGVEWLGEVPAHWTVGRYKFCTTRVVVGIAEAATHAYAEEGVPIIRSTNIREEGLDTSGLLYIKPEFAEQNNSKYLLENDIVTVRTGYPGVSAVVPLKLDRSQCFTNLVATPNSSANSTFLCEYLNAHFGKTYFSLQGWGSAQKNISVPILQNIPVVFPGEHEQEKIAKYVAIQRIEFSKLSANAEAMVELLAERRTALISAAVTGKIDVRNWQPPTQAKAEVA